MRAGTDAHANGMFSYFRLQLDNLVSLLVWEQKQFLAGNA